MTEKITKRAFDEWWTNTYLQHIGGLMPKEIDAIVDYHWRELQAIAIKHSLRETKGEVVYCTCNTFAGGSAHTSNCPLYQEAQE